MTPTRAALIQAATEVLAKAGVDESARDARLLMRWACGMDGAILAAHLDEPCTFEQETRFAIGMQRRAAREPLSHITGRRRFWEHDFRVTRDVLDPRPETEVLVAEALNRGPFQRVLDLGTGSGCILISLLAAWPEAHGVGTDISQAALAVARGNAEESGVAAQIDLQLSDWFETVDGCFDLIVSNPPYISMDEMSGLTPEVRDHEPHQALTPGGDGLGAYRAIAEGAAGYLAPDGQLMVEIGPSQAMEVSAILTSAGLHVHAILPDLDQRPRVITARL